MATARPQPISVDPDGIPEEMRQLRRWVVWEYLPPTTSQNAKGSTKWRKPPRTPEGGYASSTDSMTWSPWNWCWEAYSAGGWDGVGFVLAAADQVACIDLDRVVDGTTGDIVVPLAQRIVDHMDCWTEYSPSGTGIHMLCRGKLPGAECKQGWVELYDHARYLCLTGQLLAEGHRTLCDRQQRLDVLHGGLFADAARRVDPEAAKDAGASEELTTVVSSAVRGEGVTHPRAYVMTIESIEGNNGNDAMCRAVCVLRDSGLTAEEAVEFLVNEWNEKMASPPWSEAELQRAVVRYYGRSVNKVSRGHDSTADSRSEILQRVHSIYGRHQISRGRPENEKQD